MTIKFGYGRSPARSWLAGGLSCASAEGIRIADIKPYRIRIPFVSRFESKPFRKRILESNAGGEGEAGGGTIPDRLDRQQAAKRRKTQKMYRVQA